MDADDDARMIGARLRRIRNSRKKSLRVVAGLAGISKSKLSCIERGEIALDSRSDIVALANVLRIAPSELTSLPVPAPGDGSTDAAVNAVRLALMAASRDRIHDQVVPLDVLQRRVQQIRETRRQCGFSAVGERLPGLIGDIHASIVAGREVKALAVVVHGHVTLMWLRDSGASVDLRWKAAVLAQGLAERLGDVTSLGVAAFCSANALLASGAFDLAEAELGSLTLPPTTAGHGGHDRNGNVGLWEMALALEAGESDRAVGVAHTIQPERYPFKTRQSRYWMDYSRALARLRGRQDDAVRALRIAEELFPMRVLRNPFARDVIGELVARCRRDAVGRELRAMA